MGLEELIIFCCRVYSTASDQIVNCEIKFTIVFTDQLVFEQISQFLFGGGGAAGAAAAAAGTCNS